MIPHRQYLLSQEENTICTHFLTANTVSLHPKRIAALQQNLLLKREVAPVPKKPFRTQSQAQERWLAANQALTYRFLRGGGKIIKNNNNHNK
jgi:hypothetical protein